jgi:hypothetical protein
VRNLGNLLEPPGRIYVEIHINGPKTNPTIESRFTVLIFVIATPRSTDNIYQYINVANQFHDFLEQLAIMVPDAGCLVQDGILRVEDLGFIDKAETIRQAKVTCEVNLDY